MTVRISPLRLTLLLALWMLLVTAACALSGNHDPVMRTGVPPVSGPADGLQLTSAVAGRYLTRAPLAVAMPQSETSSSRSHTPPPCTA